MKTQGWGVKTIAGFGILAAWFVACAGGDIPPVDNELRGALIENFGGQDGQMAGGGAAGAGGDGESGAAGAGGDGGAASGAAGTGGSGSPGGAGSVGGSGSSANVCDAYTTVFLGNCAGSNCHGDGAINGVFAGADPPVAGDLVDQVSTRGPECGVLVDPSNTENSLILDMVLGQQGPTCFAVPMPLGGDDLPAEDIDCITEWLTQFAD
jgi:hypothetical protein